MTRFFIIVGGLLIVGAAAYFVWLFLAVVTVYDTPGEEEQPADQETQQEDAGSVEDEGEQKEENIVIYSDNGYSPKTITIQQGEEVVWKNESSQVMWTASAIHPTHEVYPGSSVGKCNKGEADEIFDACQGIVPGASWSFRFNEAGEWGYHNHLGASDTGKVIIE